MITRSGHLASQLRGSVEPVDRRHHLETELFELLREKVAEQFRFVDNQYLLHSTAPERLHHL